jgi:hypothetical protein
MLFLQYLHDINEHDLQTAPLYWQTPFGLLNGLQQTLICFSNMHLDTWHAYTIVLPFT